jgi:hypothetical protein
MSDPQAAILGRLEELGFRIRLDGFTPFGEALPIVSAVAWDVRTAQLALIAEMEQDDESAWRQLLFAASGLRHNLSKETPSAFGTPVVLAIVDDRQEEQLRQIAEDIAQRYLLFTRVDLNLVNRGRLKNKDQLDDALAPLLPRCRDLLGKDISRAEISAFWAELEREVKATAAGLDPIFRDFRTSAGEAASASLTECEEQNSELPAPAPVSRLRLSEFRSIQETEVAFRAVTIVHGPNGGGKSSILEGLELDWAGTSSRKPSGVAADEYARHLPRNGGPTSR